MADLIARSSEESLALQGHGGLILSDILEHLPSPSPLGYVMVARRA
jgi:hypothetical protein